MTMAQKRTALITGASSGIGAAFAHILAVDGFNLILAARRAERLEDLAERLGRSTGASAEVLVTDLSNADDLARVRARLADPARPVDVLINNAGVGLVGSFDSMPDAEIERMATLNMVAPTLLARSALAAMAQRGQGGILNVASTAAFQPGPGMAVYFATKAYVASLSQALWAEARASGVTVTALCPGPTRSELAASSHLGDTNVFRGPLPVAEAEDVARFGYEALKRRRPLAVHGVVNRLLVEGTRFVPRRVSMAIAAHLLGSV